MDEIADAIASDFTLPFEGVFVFFGHSLGTIIAYEVAQRLRQLGRNQPTRLLMSAHRAPTFPVAAAYLASSRPRIRGALARVEWYAARCSGILNCWR